MTKKDYVKFAIMLAEQYENSKNTSRVQNIIQATKDIFEQDNVKFDRDKFDGYIIKEVQKIKESRQYHDNAKYIDCKKVDSDYCDKCGYTQGHDKLK